MPFAGPWDARQVAKRHHPERVPSLSRPIRRIAPLLVAGLLSAGLAIPASAQAATTCKLSVRKSQSLGPTYVVTSKSSGKPGYRVTKTSCATGLKVVKAFHSCRLKKGKKGRCTTKVLGYSCTDKRDPALASPLSFDGDVVCKRGDARVTHHYTQNL
jgi:hypothetical protein